MDHSRNRLPIRTTTEPSRIPTTSYALDTDETQVQADMPPSPNLPLPAGDARAPSEAAANPPEEARPLKQVMAIEEPKASSWPDWWKAPLEPVVTGVPSLHLPGSHLRIQFQPDSSKTMHPRHCRLCHGPQA